jgi:hypothetical protein
MAQVGIGTLTPQEDLHVSGTNATIRIESLNSTNNPTYNDGTKLAPVYVDGNGDVTLGNGTGSSGTPTLNFLIDVPNFVPDDPYSLGLATGSVVNNGTSATSRTDTIATVVFTAPQDAIVEVKYGITMVIVGNNLKMGCPCSYITFDQAVSMFTYFAVDLDSNGLSTAESTKLYGQKSQYYSTQNQGIIGYPYMNGQAYFTVTAGTHTLYFYGQVDDELASYTSVGFGGAQDYLKIRVYN